MATLPYSAVKLGLNDIATVIASQRANVKKAIGEAANSSGALAALATNYADLIATVGAYGTTDAAQADAKAQLAAMTAEFTALKSVSDQIAAAVV